MPESFMLDEVVVKVVTEKALLVEYEGEEHWIPISQIVLEETDVEMERGATGSLAITPWIAEQKKLL
jgi:hypothetical protein